MKPGVSALDSLMEPIEIDTAAKNPDQEIGKRAEKLGELPKTPAAAMTPEERRAQLALAPRVVATKERKEP